MKSDPVVIDSLPVGPYAVLCYIVHGRDSGKGVVIDPGDDPGAVAGRVRELGIRVEAILFTHGHPDHVLAAGAVKEALGAPTAMHLADNEFFTSPEGIRMAVEELGLAPSPRADRDLAHGDEIDLGDFSIRVIHTPGHTPGSVCYLAGNHLFTGDTLFVGAAGRTDLIGADLDTLIQSIETRILPLPDETVIHPGHDYGDPPTSTLVREKEENPYITDFILDA